MAHRNPIAFEAVERGVKCGLSAVGVHPLVLIFGAHCFAGDMFTQMRFALQFHRGVHRALL